METKQIAFSIALLAGLILVKPYPVTAETIADINSNVVAVINENEAGLNALELGEWDIFLQESHAFTGLVSKVTVSRSFVTSNFTAIATNALQRRILLAAGWYGGTNTYLGYLEELAPLCRDGGFPRNEYRWFKAAPHHEWNLYLVKNYAQENVSNVVLYLRSVITNDVSFRSECDDILSGAAERERAAAVAAGFDD